MRRYRLTAAAALAGWAAGCGGPTQPAVRGTVTLDGQPVENGGILFESAGGKAAAAVQGGRYEVPSYRNLSPGTYRVEVNWAKPTGKKIPSSDPGMMMDETREAVPEKYNAKSTLTADVGPGENVKDFALTTK